MSNTRLRSTALAILLLGALAVATAILWRRADSPVARAIPEIDLADVDEEVRAVVESARAKVASDPLSADAWGGYGQLLRANEFAKDADSCFEEAERLNPNDARWPYYRGLYAQSGSPDGVPRGLPHFRRALQVGHPSSAYQSMLRIKMASVLLEQSEFDEAEALFKEEAAVDPGNARVQFGMGSIAAARNQFESAEPLLASLAQNPYCRLKALTALASLSQRCKRIDEARKYEERAREFPPDREWADPFVEEYRVLQVGRARLERIAGMLVIEGRHRDALMMRIDISERYPSVQHHLQTADSYSSFGDNSSAERYCRLALQLEPDSGVARYMLAVVKFSAAKAKWRTERNAATALFRECVPMFQRSLDDKPDNADAYLRLGQALHYLEEKKQAVEALRMAVACRPNHYDSLLALGETLAASGQSDEALKTLETAERLAGPKEKRHKLLLESLHKMK
jgi:tetratricopeptide (TPR) repeat protein